jgi:hypothetical protein
MTFVLTHRTYQRINSILAALQDGRKTSKELAAIIHVGDSSMGNIIHSMLRSGYITKHQIRGVERRFEYSANLESVPLSVIVGRDDGPPPTPTIKNPHARVIRFDTDDMQDKLRAQDRLVYVDKKRAPAHINSSWGMV